MHSSPENPAEKQAEAKYQEDSDIPLCYRKRFLVLMMLSLGMAFAYMMRTNMSVAIVAMVNHSVIGVDNSNSTQLRDGEFNWSYRLQGYILASFFYGYVITQIPFGFLIKCFGARHFLGWGMMINSVVAFFVPIAARKGGYLLLCAARFIQGLGEGPIVPCTHSMLAQWIPPDERSRSGAFVYAGAQFGTIISLPLSGFLASHGFDGGWPSIFYIFGALSTVWCILFICLVPEDPNAARGITKVERDYIITKVWTEHPTDLNEKTPFCSIFASMAFWAIMIAHCGQNYGYETLMTELPTFMAMVMGLDIKANGLLSSLPYVAMWIMAQIFAVIADKLIRLGFSITNTRKLMNSIGQYVPAVTLVAVGYCQNDLFLTVFLFTLAMGFNGAIYSGFKINHLDLSPRYAGLLISITNCCANLVGITAPMVAGHIIDHDPSIENWRIVFLITALFYCIGATVYVIFATGERQW